MRLDKRASFRSSALRRLSLPALTIVVFSAHVSIADETTTVSSSMSPEVEEIVVRLLAAEAEQESRISDVTVQSQLVERRLKGNGEVKEEKRFDKEVYFRTPADSSRYWEVHEKYLSYSKNDELQKEKKLRDEVKDKIKKQKKGRGNDKSRPITDVFLEKHREFYQFSYKGVIDTQINGYNCHLIEVRSRELKEDKKDRLNADFYIDVVSSRVVYVSFAPAKLSGNLMFKFKELAMNLSYSEIEEGVWFPERFWMRGRAKAGIFFSVRFEVSETYSNAQLNTGLDGEMFTESMSYEPQDG